ncbi:hypothetical protein HK099_005400 [Clydaea vesicula]|uniref:Uncharacterized protein n=1 Tax=Clydaea vesicula TaxID=447962 RepID=A0AAD5U3V4_9FUNG|nr:hypothetical protein HK099_005400 [Clydaea vesicula]
MGFKDKKLTHVGREFDHERVYTDSKKTLTKTGLGILFLAVGFMGAFSQVFNTHSFNTQLHTKMELFNQNIYKMFGFTIDGELCSGHGVVAKNSKCLCDLGYAGPLCSDAVSSGKFDSQEPYINDFDLDLNDPTPNSVLIVTESIGDLNLNQAVEAESTSSLAFHLVRAGFQVSVLYVGTETPMFWKFQRDLRVEGVSLIRLPSLGLSFGENPTEERSYEVYQYLIRQQKQYATVHFTAHSGTGFYTLMAQKQGLICSKTKYIVQVDRLPPGDTKTIEMNDPNFVVTDLNTLKLDYITLKSVEYADNLVFSSKYLLETVRKLSWKFSTFGTNVIERISSIVETEDLGIKEATLKELVFVGPMTTIDGLKLFCESVDLVAEELGKAGISVSFVGFEKTVDDVPSGEWIDIYASNWEEYGLKWNVIKLREVHEILSYLKMDSGRIAVLPALLDFSSTIARELLFNRYPFISSYNSAIKDMILEEDKVQVLSNPTAAEFSERFRNLITNSGKEEKIKSKKIFNIKFFLYFYIVIVARPSESKSFAVDGWIDIHKNNAGNDISVCNKKYEETEDYPLVSIVLVHHNRGHLLKQAVESIEAQTYPNIEVVLVDDGSTDKESIRILESITWGWWENKGWKVIREKNKYLGAARNAGVKHAAGKYVVFMDDDDLAKPHQVETLVKVAINRNAEVVTSGHDVFTGMKGPTSTISLKRYLPLGAAKLPGMLENVFGDSKMLVNRELFISSGGFTEDYGVGFEDYEFLAKMALNDKAMEAVSEPLNWYRRHDDAMSYQTNLKQNQLRMLRAYAAVNGEASPAQQGLLQHTQEMFFKRDGIKPFVNEPLPNTTLSHYTTVNTFPQESSHYVTTLYETLGEPSEETTIAPSFVQQTTAEETTNFEPATTVNLVEISTSSDFLNIGTTVTSDDSVIEEPTTAVHVAESTTEEFVFVEPTTAVYVVEESTTAVYVVEESTAAVPEEITTTDAFVILPSTSLHEEITTTEEFVIEEPTTTVHIEEFTTITPEEYTTVTPEEYTTVTPEEITTITPEEITTITPEEITTTEVYVVEEPTTAVYVPEVSSATTEGFNFEQTSTIPNYDEQTIIDETPIFSTTIAIVVEGTTFAQETTTDEFLVEATTTSSNFVFEFSTTSVDSEVSATTIDYVVDETTTFDYIVPEFTSKSTLVPDESTLAATETFFEHRTTVVEPELPLETTLAPEFTSTALEPDEEISTVLIATLMPEFTSTIFEPEEGPFTSQEATLAPEFTSSFYLPQEETTATSAPEFTSSFYLPQEETTTSQETTLASEFTSSFYLPQEETTASQETTLASEFTSSFYLPQEETTTSQETTLAPEFTSSFYLPQEETTTSQETTLAPVFTSTSLLATETSFELPVDKTTAMLTQEYSTIKETVIQSTTFELPVVPSLTVKESTLPVETTEAPLISSLSFYTEEFTTNEFVFEETSTVSTSAFTKSEESSVFTSLETFAPEYTSDDLEPTHYHSLTKEPLASTISDEFPIITTSLNVPEISSKFTTVPSSSEPYSATNIVTFKEDTTTVNDELPEYTSNQFTLQTPSENEAYTTEEKLTFGVTTSFDFVSLIRTSETSAVASSTVLPEISSSRSVYISETETIDYNHPSSTENPFTFTNEYETETNIPSEPSTTTTKKTTSYVYFTSATDQSISFATTTSDKNVETVQQSSEVHIPTSTQFTSTAVPTLPFEYDPVPSGPSCTYDCSGFCKPDSEVKYFDPCYVCGGDGTSCRDCTGKVNGTAVVDACDKCNGKADTCHKYVANEPEVIPNKAGINFTVYGAGFELHGASGEEYTHVFLDGKQVPVSQITQVGKGWLVVSFPTKLTLNAAIQKFEITLTQPGAKDDDGSDIEFPTYPLWVYDSATSVLDSIEPVEVNIDSTNPENLKGSFLSFPRAACVFNNNIVGYQSPATYENKQYSCSLPNSPALQTAERYDVNLVYSAARYPIPNHPATKNLDVRRSEYYLDTSAKVFIKVFDHAPVVDSVRVTDVGNAIQVTFEHPFKIIDAPTYVASAFNEIKAVSLDSTVPCSLVFGSNSGVLFDPKSPEDCVLSQTSAYTLRLSFSFGSTNFEVGNELEFLPNTVVKSTCVYCHALVGKHVIRSPYHPVKPNVIINGPSAIGPCPDLTLDISQTFGSAGREWKSVQITFSSNSTSSTELLNSFLPELAHDAQLGSQELIIPKDYLPEGSYVFSLKFTNHLNEFETGFYQFKKLPFEVPYVVLSSDNGYYNLNSYNLQTFRASALLKCPATDNKKVTFSWSSLDTSSPLPSPGISRYSGSTLNFPSHHFAPNKKYSYSLIYGWKNETQTTVVTTSIFTNLDVIYVSSGASKVVGALNKIVLNPIIFDQFYHNFDANLFAVTYLCRTSYGGLCMSATTKVPIVLSSAEDYDLTGQLESGYTYVFTALVTNKITYSTTTGSAAYITVVDGLLPSLEVHPSELNPSYLAQNFYLEAKVEPLNTLSNISYAWSIPKVCNFKHYVGLQLDPSFVATTKNSHTFKLFEGALAPATEYCVEVQAVDTTTGLTATANVPFIVGDVPSGGTCALQSAADGEALAYQFQLACMGWSSPEGPFRYEFSIKEDNDSGDTNGWSVISPAASSAMLSTTLPSGNWKVLTTVYDQSWATNLDLPIIKISSSPSPKSKRDLDVNAIFAESITNYDNTQDVHSALKTLSVLFAGIPKGTSIVDVNSYINNGLPLARKVIESGNLFFEVHTVAPYVASILKKSVSSVEVNELEKTVVDGLFWFTEKFLTELRYNQPSKCFNNEVAQSVYSAIDASLSSLLSANALSAVVSKGYFGVLSKLRECQYNNQVCNEEPHTFNGNHFDITTGIVDTNLVENFCNFKVKNFGPYYQKGCQKFTCEDANLFGAYPKDYITHYNFSGLISDETSSLKFFDRDNKVIVLKDARIEGVINDKKMTAQITEDHQPVVFQISNTGGDFANTSLNTATANLTSYDESGNFYFNAHTNGLYAVYIPIEICEHDPLYPELPRNCNNDCPSSPDYLKWSVDSCDATKCVLTETKDDSKDECSVCYGDNTTCADCFGVPNGEHEVEPICGQCVIPGTPVKCFTFTAIEPYYIPFEDGAVITLVGNQFTQNDTSVTLNDQLLTFDDNLQFVNSTMLTYTIYKNSTLFADPGKELALAKFNIARPRRRIQTAKFLKYYNPESTKVNSISPYTSFANVPNTYTITGENLFKTASPICVFKSGNTYVKSVATFVDTNTYICENAVIPFTGVTHAYILYHTPVFSTLEYSKENLYRPNFFVKENAELKHLLLAAPPVILEARFSDNGASIFIDFSSSITVLRTKSKFLDNIPSLEAIKADAFDFTVNKVYCSSVFYGSSKTENYGQLWRNQSVSDCIVTVPKVNRLQLQFSGAFSLDALSTPISIMEFLKVVPDVIINRNTIYSGSVTQSVLVQAPIKAPQPTVIVSASSLIGACAPIELDLSNSYGSAGRPWSDIQLTYTSTNPSNQTRQDAIVSALNTQKNLVKAGKLSVITLSRDILDVASYSFTVTFVNFLGGVSSSTVFIEKSGKDDIPWITTGSDNGLSELSNFDVQILRAKVKTIVGCGVQSNVLFEWSILPNIVVSDPKITLDSNYVTKSGLVIPEYTFLPKRTYNFILTARFDKAGANSYKFPVAISTSKDKIEASPGPSKTLGTLNNIILNSVILNDYYKEFKESQYSCTWECLAYPNNDVLSTSEACIDAKTMAALSIGNGCSSIDLTNSLDPGTYKFSLEVTNLDTSIVSKKSYSYISVLEGLVPVAAIVPSSLKPGSHSKTFSLQSVVDIETISGKDIKNVKFSWTAEEECYGETFTVINLEQGVTTLTNPKKANLKFAPGKLQPSAEYCFLLQVTDVNNPNIGRSSYNIPIRDQPSSGLCTADVTEGNAFVDKFTISCNGWVTDDASYPINYRFKYSSDLGETYQLLGALSSSSVFATTLSAGTFYILPEILDTAQSQNPEDSQAPIILKVNKPVDAGSLNKRLFRRGEVMEAQSLVEIRKRELSYAAKIAVNYTMDAETAFVATQDALSAITAAAVAISSLPETLATEDDLGIQAAILSLLKTIINSGNWYLDPVRAAPFCASLLKGTVASNTDHSLPIVESIFTLVSKSTVDILKNSGKTCYSDEASNNFLRTIEAVLGSLQNTKSYSELVSNTWANSMKSVNNCQFNVRICGQLPFSYSGNYLTYETGFADATDNSDYCNFEIDNVNLFTSPPQADGCIRYSCRSTAASGVLSPYTLTTSNNSTIPNIELSNKISRLAFFGSNLAEVGLVNAPLTGAVELDDAFLDKYSFLKSGLLEDANFQASVVKLEFKDSNRLYSELSINENAAELTSVSGKKALFTGSDAGNFIMLIKKQDPSYVPPTLVATNGPSPTSVVSEEPVPVSPDVPGSSPMAAIGGAVGAAVVLAIIAGAIIGLKKKRAKKEPLAKPTVEETPLISDVIVQINDAPTRDPALLPNYQLPPSYNAFMTAKEDGVILGPSGGEVVIDMEVTQPDGAHDEIQVGIQSLPVAVSVDEQYAPEQINLPEEHIKEQEVPLVDQTVAENDGIVSEQSPSEDQITPNAAENEQASLAD